MTDRQTLLRSSVPRKTAVFKNKDKQGRPSSFAFYWGLAPLVRSSLNFILCPQGSSFRGTGRLGTYALGFDHACSWGGGGALCAQPYTLGITPAQAWRLNSLWTQYSRVHHPSDTTCTTGTTVRRVKLVSLLGRCNRVCKSWSMYAVIWWNDEMANADVVNWYSYSQATKLRHYHTYHALDQHCERAQFAANVLAAASAPNRETVYVFKRLK